MNPKISIEHLAKLEHAIKQKYGEEAIIDPRQNWNSEKEKDYLEQVKESSQKDFKNEESLDRIEKNGFLLTKKLVTTTSNNKSCPVCSKYFLNNRDLSHLTKYDCCSNCYILYVENREERWISGWRPII